VRDPLEAFLHEKAAAEQPAGLNAPKHVTKDPDPHSRDPGERAMVGILATGGIAGKVIPFVTNIIGQLAAERGSHKWPQSAPIRGSSVGDALENAHRPHAKLMGMFDVSSRQVAPRADPAWVERVLTNPARPGDRAEFARLGVTGPEHLDRLRVGEEMSNIRNVVDSFIEKHDLTRKGVGINFGRGPLGQIGGPRYHISSKQVYLPRVSKEIALHELGHAADYTKGFGKVRGVLEPILSRGVRIALPVALIAGDRIKEMMPGTVDDKAISFMQDHAPAIMGATLAATSLYPEAKASFLAVRHISQTEGHAAARSALKKLIPAWSTYLMGAIPAVVGMALARKYMRHAREEKHRDLQKVGGVIGELGASAGSFFRNMAGDLGHIGKQVGHQSWSMIKEPGLAQRVGHAAKTVGSSPEFVYGALSTAIPATMTALYLYGTPAGKEIRNRIHPEHRSKFIAEGGKNIPFTSHTDETWREANPHRFAGLVAVGAALSGGVLSKFFADLQRVL
jgi:hypothetical protein